MTLKRLNIIILTIAYALAMTFPLLIGFPVWLNAIITFIYVIALLQHCKPSPTPQSQPNSEPTPTAPPSSTSTSTSTPPAQDALKQELAMAKRVQLGILDIEDPQVEGITVARRCIPATNVGGDFYNILHKDVTASFEDSPIPGITRYVDTAKSYLGVGIGDVAGHGVSSALVMSLSFGLVNQVGLQERSPASVFSKVNAMIARYIENSQVAYVTAFYAVIDPQGKRLWFSKAGHPPALILHQDGSLSHLECDGIFLGMYDDETYEEKEVSLAAGDRLILFTDGLLEARNAQGEQFESERFEKLIQDTRSQSANEALDTIFNTVDSFTGTQEQADDQTLVIVDIH